MSLVRTGGANASYFTRPGRDWITIKYYSIQPGSPVSVSPSHAADFIQQGTTDILTGQNVELSWIDIIATRNTIQQGIHRHLALYKVLN